MTTFDDREKAFENKFAHDEALQFRAGARRNKLLGLWAAGVLGKTGDEANSYAADLVAEDINEHGEEDVFRKLSADLGDKSDTITIRTKMAEFMADAKHQIANES